MDKRAVSLHFAQEWVDQDKLRELTRLHRGLPHETQANYEWWKSTHLEAGPDLRRDRPAALAARQMGLPRELRGQLWLRLSGGHKMLLEHPHMYEDSYLGKFAMTGFPCLRLGLFLLAKLWAWFVFVSFSMSNNDHRLVEPCFSLL